MSFPKTTKCPRFKKSDTYRCANCGRAREYHGTKMSGKGAEIARLRAALKPFADLARTYKVETGEFNSPDEKPLFGLNDAKITVGDMRAALKALEEG